MAQGQGLQFFLGLGELAFDPLDSHLMPTIPPVCDLGYCLRAEHSQTYSQRITSVEQALADLKVEPRKGMSLADVAVKILAALDRVKENVR